MPDVSVGKNIYKMVYLLVELDGDLLELLL
jgi:hypothetical protein